MPYVDPAVQGCSVFLYESEAESDSGAGWGGSGAIVAVPSEANPAMMHFYAVSNAHVVARCPVLRTFPTVMAATTLVPDEPWQTHPDGDDVAALYIAALPTRAFWHIPVDMLLTEQDLDLHKIGPGDECLMVGRYIDGHRRQLDRPVVRFGNLAMLPEPVPQQPRGFDQDSFLVDMRSQPGYSGSPVYVYFEADGWRDPLPIAENASAGEKLALRQEQMKQPSSTILGTAWVLGFNWGHLPVFGDVVKNGAEVGRMQVDAGLACVVPAWKVRDLLDQQNFRMEREEADKAIAADSEAEG